MPKGSKKTATRCDKHDFLLRPIVENVSHPQYLTLSFCMCQEERRSRTVQSSSACLQAPTFNNDHSFASQAFILPCDKVTPISSRITTNCAEIRCWRSIS